MSNLNSSFDTLFSKMENFISSKTVVGEPLEIGDTIVLPLVDISFMVGAGSGGDKEKGSGGGGGLGAKISPSAVIVIQNGAVQMINVKNQDSVNKLIDMVPGIVSKLNFGPFKKDSEKEPTVTEVKFDEEIILETENMDIGADEKGEREDI